jgi:TRAP-type C4-dicarboxylate transport system substrate-binding protein
MIRFLSAAAAHLGLLVLAASTAAETVLKIETWATPQHVQNSVVLPAWARFVLARIIELPGLGAGAREASIAYQRIHERHLAKAQEHDGIKLLAVFSQGAGVIHSTRRLTAIDDFSRLKVRVPGGVASEVAKALGVISVPAPAGKVYEILERGAADAVTMTMEAKQSLKLWEVAPHTLIMPGGLYNGGFFIGMSPTAYGKLSKADQGAIDRASGEGLAHLAGTAWARADDDGLAFATEKGNFVELANPSLARAIRRRIAGIEMAWTKQASGKGVDVTKALADLRAEVKRLKVQN